MGLTLLALRLSVQGGLSLSANGIYAYLCFGHVPPSHAGFKTPR
ncbi:MAG: hypothetical protein AAF808_20745 [Cyanobacteria bacterium P01_D01_bin.2]